LWHKIFYFQPFSAEVGAVFYYITFSCWTGKAQIFGGLDKRLTTPPAHGYARGRRIRTMDKALKMTLGVLFAAQLIIAVREPSGHLWKRLHGGEDGGQNDRAVAARVELWLKRAWYNITRGEHLMAPPPLPNGRLGSFVHEGGHDHSPDHEKGWLGRLRRRLSGHRLTVNLYPLFRVMEPTGCASLHEVAPYHGRCGRFLLFGESGQC
jgi:hypothetical protein